MQNTRINTQWGYIDWLEDKSITLNNPLYFRMEHIAPGTGEDEHVHYAECQFIQIVSGTVLHILNGVKTSYSAGESFFLPLGAIHSNYNEGTEEAVQLVVVIPALFHGSERIMKQTQEPEQQAIDTSFMRHTYRLGIRQLTRETLNHLSMPVIFTDSNHNYIYHTHLARECKNCRNHACPLWSSSQLPVQQFGDRCETTVCPGGLTVLLQPVHFGTELVGYIKGGLFSEHYSMFVGESSPLFVPGSRFHSTLVFLKDMGAYLQTYYKDAQLEYKLRISQTVVQREEQHIKSLISAYEETKDTALNLQIRNHFLFNTLNSIASLAINDGSYDTYTAILNLSELFRGMLRNEGTRVQLQQELDFLKNYLELEKLRFEDKLAVIWNISEKTKGIIVPHNFLQPIVENSFKHAFRDMSEIKKIKIKSNLKQGRAIIEISDNGCGMDEETLGYLKSSMQSSSAHGLSMVTRKLNGVFATDFSIDIISKPGKGTTFRISLPT